MTLSGKYLFSENLDPCFFTIPYFLFLDKHSGDRHTPTGKKGRKKIEMQHYLHITFTDGKVSINLVVNVLNA